MQHKNKAMKKISNEAEYLKALKRIREYEKTNSICPVRMEIKEAVEQVDDYDKLQGLNTIAEDLANEFTYHMSLLEKAIEETLWKVSDEAKEQTGYHSVEDVTQNISVTRSCDYHD